jgi:hypothetical protein
MSQRDGVVMVEMKVLVMMMILMKSNLMVMTMAMISPLRKGISLVDFCLPESFSLSVFSALQRRRCLSLSPPQLRFLGMTIYTRGQWQKWASVASPQGGAARGWPATPGGVGPLLLLSLSPFGYFRLLVIYEFLGIFLEFFIFRNMVS